MAARRLIFVLLVLLMISSFAAALVPIERSARDDESSSTTTTETTEAAAPPAGELKVRTIRAGEHPRTVRIRLGDQLQLAVAADALDEVEIPALGEIESVDPGSPALFDLLPLDPGRYSIRLVDADRVVGSIEVEAAEPRTIASPATRRPGMRRASATGPRRRPKTPSEAGTMRNQPLGDPWKEREWRRPKAALSTQQQPQERRSTSSGPPPASDATASRSR